MHTWPQQRGTTLIELMIYLAISTGIIIGVGSVGLSVLDQKEKALAINDVRYGEAMLSRILTYDVREASMVVTPPLGVTSSTTLVLRSVFSERDPIVYVFANGAVSRTVGTSSPVELLPSYVTLRNVSISPIGATGTAQAVFVRGEMRAGEGTLGNAFRYENPFMMTATTRAPQPQP